MSAFTDLTETTISRKEQYSGPLFTVHSDEVRLPNGNTSVREVIEHVDGVAVLPLDEHNNVLTVTQYRYVFGKTLLEIPAGKLDPDEFLTVERIPFDEMVHRCMNGEIQDAKTVAAVLKAKLLLNL